VAFLAREEPRFAGAALSGVAGFFGTRRRVEAAGFLVTFFAMARLSYEKA
jgi:hypothetical protein